MINPDDIKWFEWREPVEDAEGNVIAENVRHLMGLYEGIEVVTPIWVEDEDFPNIVEDCKKLLISKIEKELENG